MAAGRSNWLRAHGKPHGFLRVCPDKNMKQIHVVTKEELEKDGFKVHRKVQSPGKARRLSCCKRKSGASLGAGVKLQRSSSDAGRPRQPGMAKREKENEMTCCDDVRAPRCHGNGGLLVNASPGMAGASSECSHFTELSKDHDAMSRILFGRDLQLKVALTLWRRSACELVSYLTRLQDTSLLIDCLPVLTNNLQTESTCVSLGCCVDLMPQVKVILSSAYENNVTLGLHWVQAVIRKWWPELSTKDKRLRDSCSEDRNVDVMRKQLKDLWKDGVRFCSLPGTAGELAKVIGAHISQLP